MVLCIDVVEHLPSLLIAEEAQRILAKGDTFLLSTADKYEPILQILEKLRLKLPEGPHTWRESEEILQELSKAGFSCTKWSKASIGFYKCTKS